MYNKSINTNSLNYNNAINDNSIIHHIANSSVNNIHSISTSLISIDITTNGKNINNNSGFNNGSIIR